MASRDLRPGEIITIVDPLVVGPPQGCQPLCLGCYKKLDFAVNTYRSVTEELRRVISVSQVLTLRRLMSYIYMEHPFLIFLDHTQRRTTVGRTPLDE